MLYYIYICVVIFVALYFQYIAVLSFYSLDFESVICSRIRITTYSIEWTLIARKILHFFSSSKAQHNANRLDHNAFRILITTAAHQSAQRVQTKKQHIKVPPCLELQLYWLHSIATIGICLRYEWIVGGWFPLHNI